MHQFNDNLNIRQNGTNTDQASSIWPSFTDIMTVVLMIFMLSMIGLIMKNAILTKEMAQMEKIKNKSEMTIDELRSFANTLELRLASLNDSLLKKERDLSSRDSEIQILLDEKDLLLSKSLSDSINMLILRDSLASTDGKLNEVNGLLTNIQQTHQSTLNNLYDSLNGYKQRIIILNTEKKQAEIELAKTRDSYESLEGKYNKLAGKARSPKGKKVATVHYSMKNGRGQILYKPIGGSKYSSISKSEMHSRLTKLKKQWGSQLYVKVIIPKNSGLDFNAAWSFTRSILNKYDYYYQK